MKIKPFKCMCFCALLILISIVAIEPSEYKKQFDETKESETSIGVDCYSYWPDKGAMWKCGIQTKNKVESDGGNIIPFPGNGKGRGRSNVIPFPKGGRGGEHSNSISFPVGGRAGVGKNVVPFPGHNRKMDVVVKMAHPLPERERTIEIRASNERELGTQF
ncbi:uncharacterized protein LOC131647984 [Vicia villosa]|uniref:uncharacterized protein LOC131647984 n=1 Tax=Vicia villosa TaxID=3911 RepID=UPI00273C151F|nr:uncharacterized protein LOC131647984 [Vicia villosa]